MVADLLDLIAALIQQRSPHESFPFSPSLPLGLATPFPSPTRSGGYVESQMLLVPGIVVSLIFLNLIHTFANCPFINFFELLYLYVLLPSYRTLFDMPIVEFGTKLCINV